ncbi:Uncharacterized protein dnl_11200 [Desulfonema limicola]|uniref:Uncharacterized protein n=1 Tax=Desulfonema limicola TaxID=45656 RepID=A0A975B4Y9_9BACT|nr:hypothetical protein [Desulfonema limicola]QTA78876.1 Uncharacterized protein dnl_11200 [Desulfonema limicola]
MTRLSSPESALKKISDIYTQIESFYETIDLIKKFKDKFTASYEQASEHENQLKIHVAEFENIKKIYNKTVENLKHLCIFLENMLQQSAGEFVYEKTEIRAALEQFAADSRIIQNHHLSLDRELNNTIKNITADMAYMIYNHEAAVNNQLLKTALITDLGLQAVQNQSDTLALAGQEIKEEIYELEHEINFFLAQAAFRLKKRFTGFDKLRNLYKDAVQRLLEIENRSEKDFLLILNEFIYEKQGLRNLISETVQERIKTRNQNNALKNNINNALKELEHQIAYLAKQLKQSGLDNRLQLAQSTDQAKYEISQKLDHLSFESMKFNEQFGELEDDLKAFQSRIKAKLDRNIKILNQKNKSFLQSSDHKAQDRFYKAEKNLKNQIDIEIQKMMSELKNEKDKINSSIAFLNTQKIEIDEHLKNLNTTRENIDFASETAVYRLEAVRTQSEKELKRIILEFEQEKKVFRTHYYLLKKKNKKTGNKISSLIIRFHLN